MVHAIGFNVGFLHIFGLFDVILGNDLDPVLIGIQSKLQRQSVSTLSSGFFTDTHSDVMHPAVLQLLLKLISRVLQSLTRSLDVVHRDADMPETFSGLLVAIVWLVGSIILRAIVVSELNDALAISPVIAGGYGLGRVATDPTTSALRFTGGIQFLSSHETHYAKKYKSKELSGKENLLTCFIPKCS